MLKLDDSEKSFASVSAILFFILALQTGMPPPSCFLSWRFKQVCNRHIVFLQKVVSPPSCFLLFPSTFFFFILALQIPTPPSYSSVIMFLHNTEFFYSYINSSFLKWTNERFCFQGFQTSLQRRDFINFARQVILIVVVTF